MRFFHGTRTDLRPGALIAPAPSPDGGQSEAKRVFLTPNLDEAIWDAELAVGEEPPRVYSVEPIGPVEQLPPPPGHPSMSCCSREPLRVIAEVTAWNLYHGTRADLKPGDLIEPGHAANFGDTARVANHVYFARTLDAATWGAELATGDGPGRIYVVEPTGAVEDDPNLTNTKFRGNPTKSFRSASPVRVVREVLDWKEHSPEALRAMKDGLDRLSRLGIATIDD
jgi:hypothetical protein